MFSSNILLKAQAVKKPDENKLEVNYLSSTECYNYELLNCTVCFKVFSSLIALQRHYIKHVVNKPFSCQQCEKSFFDEDALEKHAISHTEKHFLCEICHNKYLTDFELDYHMREHIFPDLVCNLCLEHFLKVEELHKHERSHSGIQESSVSSICYPCVLCDFQFILKRDLEHHMNDHEKIREYICIECNKSFFFSYVLQLHQKTHNDNEYCNVCAETFPNKVCLNNHEKVHLRLKRDNEIGICFACELCDAIFPFKTELEAHYNTHKSSYRYPCSVCSKTFFFSFLCLKHKRTHTENSKYKCKQCFRMFNTTAKLNRHIRNSHSLEKKNCPVCGKYFSTKWALQKHCFIHTVKRPHACSICDARFSRKNNLERHYLVHMNDKQFKCRRCKSSFALQVNLKDHLTQHEKEGVSKPCYVCKKTFISDQVMKQHIRIEHQQEGRQRMFGRASEKTTYVCGVCGKVMQTCTSFSRHKRLHTGTQPYKCKICDKVFNQKEHLFRHHGFNHPDFDFNIDLPFKCAYCHEAYIKRRGLVAHHNKQHPLLDLLLEYCKIN